MSDDATVTTADKDGSVPVQEAVTLQLDNGSSMVFSGHLYAGGSWYDDESSMLTKQSLYVTSENDHVYSVTTRQGHTRSRRAYRVGMEGDNCTINDGRQEMTIELEMLLLAVSRLAGLDKDVSALMEDVEDTLRAANC